MAATLWSLNGALIKLAYNDGQGPSPVIIAFYRSLFAGLFLLPLARGRFRTLLRRGQGAPSVPGMGDLEEGPSRVPSRSVPHPLRGWGTRTRLGKLLSIRPAALGCMVFFTLMTVCFVIAATKTEAANAIILQYTSTFWVFGLSPLILRERPGRGDLGILVLAMLGIAVIFAGQAATDLTGLLIALGAGLFYALETMMIRRLRDCDSAAVMVLNLLGSALLLLPAALLVGNLMVSPRAWVLLLLLGVVQFGLPYYLFARALRWVPAYRASLITLAEPVLVPVWTYLAVREVVPVTTAVGGGIILLALLLGGKLQAKRNNR